MKYKQLNRMYKKLKPCYGKDWCGYLIPIEIVYLYDNQLITLRYPNSTWRVDNAREEMKKGIGGGRWFYFLPTQQLLNKII